MKEKQLKEKVIDEIRKLDNDNLVSEIYALLQLEKGDAEVYELNAEQIAIIEEAQTQYKKGQLLTDEEARKDFEAWRKN